MLSIRDVNAYKIPYARNEKKNQCIFIFKIFSLFQLWFYPNVGKGTDHILVNQNSQR